MSGATRVWTPNLDAPVPTYHDWPHGGPNANGEYRTYCGLLVWDRQDSPKLNGVYLRTDHAEKIGRPCSRCFGAQS